MPLYLLLRPLLRYNRRVASSGLGLIGAPDQLRGRSPLADSFLVAIGWDRSNLVYVEILFVE